MIPIIQLENEVRVLGIQGVDSFVTFWYDVCNEFVDLVTPQGEGETI